MSGDALEIKKIEEALGKIGDQVDTAVKSLNDQVKAEGEARQELKGAVEELMKKYNETADQLHDLMQKGADRFDAEQVESFGEMFSKSEQYKQLGEGRANTARLNIKTAIINATGQNQPLVSADRRAGIIANPDRILTVRDLLPVGRTSSNLIEFAKENVFTNNAGPQVGGSPEAFENVTKPESAITFTLATAAVTTLAHFIPASKQVLSDSGMLNSYVDNRLLYGLKLKEETQLLLGAGANGELDGIYTQATALTQTSPNTTNEIDIIRMAIKQAHQSEYRPTAVLLNPADWFDIDTRKVGASDDRYVVGNPREMGQPRLWGLPVVITNSITSGTFLVGAFDIGAQIWDREDATIEVSRENSDNFVKNMVTILAEERIALTVYRPGAFIKGSL